MGFGLWLLVLVTVGVDFITLLVWLFVGVVVIVCLLVCGGFVCCLLFCFMVLLFGCL